MLLMATGSIRTPSPSGQDSQDHHTLISFGVAVKSLKQRAGSPLGIVHGKAASSQALIPHWYGMNNSRAQLHLTACPHPHGTLGSVSGWLFCSGHPW